MQPFIMKVFVVGCLMAAVMTWTNATGQEGKRRKGDPTAGIKKKLERAELPADVLAKAQKIVDEHAPKIREATAKRDAVLTAEQTAARKAAQKAAKEAGKKGRQAAADVEAATKFTGDQKARHDAAQAELTAANSAMNAALRDVLDDEQEEKVGVAKKRKKKG